MKQRFTLLLISLFFLSQNTFSQVVNQDYHYRELIRYANAYYASKDYPKSLEKYEEALKIKGTNSIDLYNTACTASLLNNTVKANDYLKKSIENGYIDVEWLKKDIDFENLRKTKYWEENVKLIKDKFQVIAKDFSRVKDIQLKNLVPFKKDGKWGYLNKESFKMVVSPNYYKVTFGGSCLKVEFTKNNKIIVDEKGEVKINRPNPQEDDFIIMSPSPDVPSILKVDPSENFKGFRVNDEGIITHVSSIYGSNLEQEFVDMSFDDIASEPKVEIYGPIKINNKWYAITCKGKSYGVIDEEGNELESLGFIFRELSWVKEYKGEDALFIFLDHNGKMDLLILMAQNYMTNLILDIEFQNIDSIIKD